MQRTDSCQRNNSSHERPNSIYCDKCEQQFKRKSGMEQPTNQKELNQDYSGSIARDFS